jgi:hypothetical protein
MVEVVIQGIVVTHQYGTLNTGDVLRTDPEFAKHLVEDCNAAKYHNPIAASPKTEMPAVSGIAELVETPSPAPAVSEVTAPVEIASPAAAMPEVAEPVDISFPAPAASEVAAPVEIPSPAPAVSETAAPVESPPPAPAVSDVTAPPKPGRKSKPQ